MKLKIDSSIDSIDLSPLKPLVDWSPGAQYFTLGAGQEHYKLLAALSDQLPDFSQVIDCGTLYGCSALALSANEKVTVHTFDIEDHVGRHDDLKLRPNIFFHQQNCLEAVADRLDGVQPLIIVLDIDPHDGKQEAKFCDALIREGYQGLLICDDIHLNDDMEQFWSVWSKDDLPQGRKIDATKLGHWSGTGIVVFDPETIDVEVML